MLTFVCVQVVLAKVREIKAKEEEQETLDAVHHQQSKGGSRPGSRNEQKR